MLTQYRVFPQYALMHPPPHLSDIEAAALPCAGLTAWGAVVKFGAAVPGTVVLTQGSGGVSLFALQFAKLAGARVIATSSSEEKIDKLRKLGADETINYRTKPEWGKQARALTAGRGVDLVVEVGGAGTLNESIRATRFGGMLAMIGVLAGPANDLRLPLVVMQQLRLQGVTVGSLDDLQAMTAGTAGDRTTCVGNWPIFLASTTVVPSNIDSAKITVFTRSSDNQQQSAFDGHPLYYFADDKVPGDDLGLTFPPGLGQWFNVDPAVQ